MDRRFIARSSMMNERIVLIVDDCLEDRETYSRYLQRDSNQYYRIVEADLAEEGLLVCQKIKCDLILLDVNLPDMNGLEFLNQLKRQHFNPPPAIVLTGFNDRQIAVQAMKNGAQDYLVKHHLQADILQLAVRNVIKNFQLENLLTRARERQRLIATTALRIRQSLNLETTLDTIVTEVRQLLECDRVLLYQFTSENIGKIVAESSKPGCDRTIDLQIHKLKTELEKAGKNRQHHYFWQAHQFERIQSKGNLTIPIFLKHDREKFGQVWGVLIANCCSGERFWQEDEANILKQLSVQLAIAIEQAELLARTQAALKKEQELNKFKSQIIATVSHEYRSPLTSILAAATTLKQYWSQLSDRKRNKLLGLIEEKARHMSRLVNEMLDINQFELSRATFKPEFFAPIPFFSELVEQQKLITNKKLEMVFISTGKIDYFWGDRDLLKQIFINLISNSIKYSPDGGKIEINLVAEELEMIFSIKDEGIGIPKAEQENLFQSFSRASNVGTIPGTGLGLAIVKACVDLHGGTICLESELDRGTIITVKLPRKEKIDLEQIQTNTKSIS